MGDLDHASEIFEETEKESAHLGMLADQKTATMSIAAIAFVQRDFVTAETKYREALDFALALKNQQ
jgi:hypothetical protein